MKKYIFVTGGVCSSLGKGIAAASIGTLLESRGFRVSMIKIDPYLNVDAGTMSPYQHGEVYVTDDGAETDLDLGNYARFTSSPLSKANSITTGQVYQTVINKEREGKYLGKTVQVIPHITDEIKAQILRIGDSPDVDITIVEVGGTVGDIESVPFLETARQCIHELGHENVLSVHLTLVPTVSGDEMKTKPTQHSVKELREIGIQPDILLCRAKKELDESMRKKIANFTNVDVNSVLSAIDVNTTIYEIPLIYHEQKLDEIVVRKLGLELRPAHVNALRERVEGYKNAQKTVTIAMVGKYVDLHDTYKSVDEALVHAGMGNQVRVRILKIDAERLEKAGAPEDLLEAADGILIPGGFGERGMEGMIVAARYAREHNKPYFGICLGMQIMVIEYARSVLGLDGAHTTEANPRTPHPVVSLLEEQEGVTKMGGTMRLGKSATHTLAKTKIREAYGSEIVWERHRHRYEVDNRYKAPLEAAGLKITGYTPDGALVESTEWTDHAWSTGVQFHPEFTSKPTNPQPLFNAFVKAAAK
jgi:CTP synthase